MTGDRRLGGHWLVTLAGRVTGVGTPLADRVTKVRRHQPCHWGGKDTKRGDTGRWGGHQHSQRRKDKALQQTPDKILSEKTRG